ncbi:MAG: response regulator [Spirochaetes bacterium]|nr:response regulator [Spirochaetota bacterium]
MLRKVLIIDDDVDIVEAEKLLLENRGYNVISAFDGKEGFRKIKEEKPDVIILDVMMATPDEGFHITRNIRNDPEISALPIVMVTSVGKVTGFKYDSERDREILPVDEYLEKPIKPEELIGAVERALSQKS